MNPYDVLGINKNASSKRIKKAYRVKARQYHPDRNPGDETANTKFNEVKLAYDILSDPERRAKYDETGDWEERTPSNEIADIMQVVGKAFGQVVSNQISLNRSLTERDLLEEISRYIKHESAQAHEEKQLYASARERLMTLLGRFTSDDGDKVMDDMIQTEIAGLGRKIDQLDEVEEIGKKAVKFLTKFKYRRDELTKMLRDSKSKSYRTFSQKIMGEPSVETPLRYPSWDGWFRT